MANRSKKSKAKRICKLIIVWGRNGTGKSTLVKKIMDVDKGKQLLATRSGAPVLWHNVPAINAANKNHYNYKKGTRQVIVRLRDDYPTPGKNDTFKLIFENFRNGFLMLDDSKQYFTDNTSNVPGLTDLLSEYRHKMIDLIVVVHSPDQLPPKIWDHASDVIIMATTRHLSQKIARSLDAGQAIFDAQKRVNEKFRRAEAIGGDKQYGIHEWIKL